MLDNPDPHDPVDCEGLMAPPGPVHVADCKTSDHFGSMITSHDVNGDGDVDLIVGGGNEPFFADTRGEVWVFLGTGAGIDPEPALKILGNGDSDLLGSAAVVLDDLNGSGPALAIGAPQWRAGISAAPVGRVYIFTSAYLSTLSSTVPVELDAEVCADYTITGTADGGWFGGALAAGDFSGNGGSCDLLVGAPGSEVSDALGGVSGAVHVFPNFSIFAPPPGLSFCVGAGFVDLDAVSVLRGRGSLDRFGHVIEPIADLGGGPGVEFAVGAPETQGYLKPGFHSSGPGYVEVYSAESGGGGWTISLVTTIDGTQFDETSYSEPVGEAWGWSLSAGGDFSGDALPDLIIGAPRYVDEDSVSTPVLNTGRVAVYQSDDWSQLFTSPTSAGTALVAEDGGSYFGYSVAGCASILNDFESTPDIVVGAAIEDYPLNADTACPEACGSLVIELRDQGGRQAGVALLYEGSTGLLVSRVVAERPKDRIGFELHLADLWGSSEPDLVTSGMAWSDPDSVSTTDKEAGRVYIFLGERF